VLVIGGGPAGLSAARTAAAGGARTAVLERATHPRYKTCGGGLIGASLANFPDTAALPVRDSVDKVTFTYHHRFRFTKKSNSGTLLQMVNREDFDYALFKAAEAAGVEIRQACFVRRIDDRGVDHVDAVLDDGRVISAKVIIGADGTSGVTRRYVGVEYDQTDLGLEQELRPSDEQMAFWRGHALLDWGKIPGSYAWVFPKGDQLTVGVIAKRGHGEETKQYLNDFLRKHHLEGLPVKRDSGHLTRCRLITSPLRKGRVIVVGDAAGLLEPWTREGISYALRSGILGGAIAGRAATLGDESVLADYEVQVGETLVEEMEAGQELFRAFVRYPIFVHLALFVPKGWRTFTRICRSEYSFVHALRHRSARLTLKLIIAARRQR
jgi:geranylgeranyl reductase family protein